jgi:hypothetical protein
LEKLEVIPKVAVEPPTPKTEEKAIEEDRIVKKEKPLEVAELEEVEKSVPKKELPEEVSVVEKPTPKEDQDTAETAKPFVEKPAKKAKPHKVRKPINWSRVLTYGCGAFAASAFVLSAMFHAEGNDLLNQYNSASSTEEAESLRLDIRSSEKSRNQLLWAGVLLSATAVGVWNADKIGVLTNNPDLTLMPDDSGFKVQLKLSAW